MMVGGELNRETIDQVPAMALPLFRRGGAYDSFDSESKTLAGRRVSLGLAPALMIEDDARLIRRVIETLPPLPDGPGRRALLRDALDRFRYGAIPFAGLEQQAGEFRVLIRGASGLPDGLQERWFDGLAAAFEEESANIESVGGLELVSLPANTFVCLSAVLAALMRADAVWVRPSRHEPFSAARLFGALLAAGWPADRLGFYATTHETLPILAAAVDRAVLFGGEDLARAHAESARITVNGPGRARALVGADVATNWAADWLLDAIATDSGRFCTNVCTILTAGDADSLGATLAARLDAVTLGGAGDVRHPQAYPGDLVDPLAAQTWIADRLRPGDKVLTARPMIVETSDGPILAPSLVALADPVGHPLLGAELPFAFAVLAAAAEARQASLSANAGFVYVIGSAVGSALREWAPRARVTEVAVR